MFRTKFSKQAEKFLSKCEQELFDRVKKKLELLKDNPVPSDAKRLQGNKEPTFRIRIGKYRVLYDVNSDEKVILVLKIDKRDKVYD